MNAELQKFARNLLYRANLIPRQGDGLPYASQTYLSRQTYHKDADEFQWHLRSCLRLRKWQAKLSPSLALDSFDLKIEKNKIQDILGPQGEAWNHSGNLFLFKREEDIGLLSLADFDIRMI